MRRTPLMQLAADLATVSRAAAGSGKIMGQTVSETQHQEHSSFFLIGHRGGNVYRVTVTLARGTER